MGVAMTIKELNKAKVPIVRIDKALEKYKDKSLFQAKVDNANEVLRTVGLPKQNTQGKQVLKTQS